MRFLRALEGFSVASPPGRPDPGLDRAARLCAEHLQLLGAAVPAPAASGRIEGAGAGLSFGLTGWDGLGSGEVTEEAVQARCGLTAVHGRAAGGPRPLGVDYVSVLAGVLAVQGILAGLLGRLRGIPVRRVELPQARAATIVMATYVATATADEDADRFATAELTGRYRPPFRSADGVRFELETLDPDRWARFWAALGAPDRAVSRSWRPFAARFGRATAPLAPELFAAAGAQPFARAVAVARETGAAVVRVRDLAERRADPDLWPRKGTPAPWELLAGPVTPGAAREPSPVPDGAVLPLSGLRVVESTSRMQGPLASRLLSMLGAHVLRVEPPGGDPGRGTPPMAGGCSAWFRAVNHGKQAVEIDFKTPGGRREVLELAAQADVFLHNWAPGKAGQLGLTPSDLAAVNPRLVYAEASGWGDALGPKPPVGTDFLVQAHSGVADLIDGRGSLVILLDVLGGAVAAEGVLAGLLGAHRTGAGVVMRSSLLSAATTLLLDELRGVTGKARRAPACPPAVPADLATTDAFEHHGCAVVTSPWRFS